MVCRGTESPQREFGYIVPGSPFLFFGSVQLIRVHGEVFDYDGTAGGFVPEAVRVGRCGC